MSGNRVLSISFSTALILLLSLLPIGGVSAAGVDDLIQAVWGFEVQKAGQLIDSGVNVNGKDANGTYPLLLACSYKNNDKMIEMLLSKGADPNVRGPNGETPLSLAAKYSLNAVKMLVGKGADINSRDSGGFTPLWWARKMGNSEVIDYLKDKGAEE